MNSKTKKLFNNTFLFLIGNIGSKFIQFLLVPLYTYTLSTSDYGITDLIFTMINFLIPIFSVQISDGLLRFGLDKSKNQDDVIRSSFRILVIGSFLSIIFLPFLSCFEMLKKWMIFFILILNLRIYKDIFSIILKIKDKNKIFAIDSILYTFVLCISSFILLVYLKLGINGYFISYIIANVFSIFFILFVSKFKIRDLFGEVDKKLMKEIFLYSSPLVINSISYWITTASDRFMINVFNSETLVGIYAVAAKIPTIITTFTGVFSQAWLISSISEANSKDNNLFYSKTFKNYMQLSFFFCAGIILFIKPFMHLYVSKEFYIAWQSSTILILSSVFSGIGSFLNGIYYTYKKNSLVTTTTVVGAILNILLNVILIKKYDIVGAAIATLISWIIMCILRIKYLKKFINVDCYNRIILILTFLILIEIVNLFLFETIIGIIINLIVLIFISYFCRDTIISTINILSSKIKRCKK